MKRLLVTTCLISLSIASCCYADMPEYKTREMPGLYDIVSEGGHRVRVQKVQNFTTEVYRVESVKLRAYWGHESLVGDQSSWMVLVNAKGEKIKIRFDYYANEHRCTHKANPKAGDEFRLYFDTEGHLIDYATIDDEDDLLASPPSTLYR